MTTYSGTADGKTLDIILVCFKRQRWNAVDLSGRANLRNSLNSVYRLNVQSVQISALEWQLVQANARRSTDDAERRG